MKHVIFDEWLQKELQNDSELKKEYDALPPLYSFWDAFYQARSSINLTQQELAKRSGISQSNISKIEKGIYNPSLKTLKRLADAMDMHIEIKFVPNK